MFNLDATDVLEGIASVTNVVEFTFSGVDGTTVVSREGKLTNAQTEIYTATAATRGYLLTLVNTHSAAVTINIQKDPADAGTLYKFLVPKDLSLGIGYSLQTDGVRISVMNPTGAIVYTYLAHTHDGDTLLLDGVNSNGGAFPFTTSGPITFTQNLIIPDAGNIGSVSDTDAIEISAAGILTFSGQSGCTVFLSANEAIAASVVEQIQFDGEEYDTRTEHDGAGTFTVTEAGIYLVTSNVTFQGGAPGERQWVKIYVNGAGVREVHRTTPTTHTQALPIASCFTLAATDTIEIWVENGVNDVIIGDANGVYTWLSIAKIG